MSLATLIRSETDGIDAIAAYLDGLDPAQRLAESRTLDRGLQRRLYDKAKQGPAVDLDHFVPPAVAARNEVIHHGWNTLPLPPPLKRFQKRFARPESGTGRLFGYNEGVTRGIVGPGFYVAMPTQGHGAWPERGEIVVDYFQIPDGPVPDGWPTVIPNSQGIQRLVYFQTRDFMRKVSQHVSVGAAYKVEKSLDHYFMLVRED
jgi:hypothetical protein